MLPTYCQDVNRFHCSVRTLRALRALTRLQKKTSNMYIYRTFCELGNAGLLRFACISKRKKKKKSNGIRTTVPVQEVNAAAATAATHDDDEHVPSPLFSYFFFFFFPALFHRLMGFVGWTRTSPAQTQCLQMRQNLIAGVCAAGHNFTQRRNK